MTEINTETGAVVYHIRTGVRRAGPRVTDRGDGGRTLCGAPLTAYDATVRDARAIVMKGWQRDGLERCVACFNKLLELDFARSNRVED